MGIRQVDFDTYLREASVSLLVLLIRAIPGPPTVRASNVKNGSHAFFNLNF